jgi:hypothetical protein
MSSQEVEERFEGKEDVGLKRRERGGDVEGEGS